MNAWLTESHRLIGAGEPDALQQGLMNAAIATARAEGIAVPPDLARGTLAATRKLVAMARGGRRG